MVSGDIPNLVLAPGSGDTDSHRVRSRDFQREREPERAISKVRCIL